MPLKLTQFSTLTFDCYGTLIDWESGIGDALATRELLSELRGAGEITGGPPPMKQGDRSLFLQQLDQAIQSIRKLHRRGQV